jgi:hypothetical protein
MNWRVLSWTVAALIFSAAGLSAQPAITELQPRGAQKGKPFTLTLVGRNLGEGAKIRSTMPASFTLLTPDQPASMPDGPMQPEGRYATFLVEPMPDLAVGVYPIRVVTSEGISNVQLFTVGAFPELVEDESRPGALPNTSDSIETSQPLPPPPFTLNGTLRGPERDIFRLSVKAGEKRVIEVEARRSGSAIDPLLEILDGNGRVVARSEDEPLLGLDARVEVAFPQGGDYYVVVRDARFSTQTANFYRLKVGSYAYPREVFPLGGRRGEVIETSLGSERVKTDLRNIGASVRQVFVNVPGSPALPVPFAVGDDPEVTTPAGDATLGAPVTINGRLTKPGQVDRHTLRVPASRAMIFRIQARELGTSKLMAVITVRDEQGAVLGRIGRRAARRGSLQCQPEPHGGRSRTAAAGARGRESGNRHSRGFGVARWSRLRVPAQYSASGPGLPVDFEFGVRERARGGLGGCSGDGAAAGLRGRHPVASRECAQRIASGGRLRRAGLPVKETPQNRNSRGVLILTSESGEVFELQDLTVEGVATLPTARQLCAGPMGRA